MKSWKNVCSVCLVVIMGFACILCSACKPQSSNPSTPPLASEYVGAVSKETYQSRVEAIVKCIEKEFDPDLLYWEETDLGDTNWVTSNGTVEQTVIDGFALTDEQKKGLQSVEEIIIWPYKDWVEHGNISARVYLLEYADQRYRYYIPMPEVGELIPFSYYAHICDPHKYLNSTITIAEDKYGTAITMFCKTGCYARADNGVEQYAVQLNGKAFIFVKNDMGDWILQSSETITTPENPEFDIDLPGWEEAPWDLKGYNSFELMSLYGIWQYFCYDGEWFEWGGGEYPFVKTETGFEFIDKEETFYVLVVDECITKCVRNEFGLIMTIDHIGTTSFTVPQELIDMANAA